MMKCYLCLHAWSYTFCWDPLGVGVKNLWMNVCVRVGVDRLYPAVRFVGQRLKLPVFSCILNPDWLLVMVPPSVPLKSLKAFTVSPE